MGSIREALRAGTYPATAATAIRSVASSINVIGSPDVTPNNRRGSPDQSDLSIAGLVKRVERIPLPKEI